MSTENSVEHLSLADLSHALWELLHKSRFPKRIYMGSSVFVRLRGIMELDGGAKLTAAVPMKYQGLDIFIVSNDPRHLSVY